MSKNHLSSLRFAYPKFVTLTLLLGVFVLLLLLNPPSPAQAASGSWGTPGNSPSSNHPALEAGDWSALGSGLNDGVYTILVNGSDVYVGGRFTDAGGNTNADYIAKYNSGTWSALGTGLNHRVHAIAIDGDVVYAGGLFTDAGGDSNADYIAKFENGSWSSLGTPLNGIVNALLLDGDTLYVGGNFTDAGGVANADYIAKYENGTWSALDTGLNFAVLALAGDSTNLYVGGSFTEAGGVPNASHIARFSGGNWSALVPNPPENPVSAIAVDNADVYIGAYLSPISNSGIYRLNGGVRYDLGSGLNGAVLTIALKGSDVYAGGFFQNADQDPTADYVAKFSDGHWSALGAGVNQDVKSIAVFGDDILVGGDFENAGSVPNADHIADFTSGPSVCTAPPSEPVLVSPANNAMHKKPKVRLDWGDTTCARAYKVVVRLGSISGKIVSGDTIGSSHSDYRTIALTPGQTYYWHVKANGTYGSTKSVWFKFTLK